VLRRIPSASRQIHAATKRDVIIDYDNLLVMACAGWMYVIEFEMNPRMPKWIAAEHELWLANISKDYGKAPCQDVNLEFGIPLDDLRKESLQGWAVPSQFGKEPNPSVKVPTQNRNRFPRLADTFRDCPIVV
jgi:hypothetical protein